MATATQTYTLTKSDVAEFRERLLKHRADEWAAESLKIVTKPGDYDLFRFEALLLSSAAYATARPAGASA